MYLRKCRHSVVGLIIFSVVFLVLTGGVVRAEYPDKPITLIVPWPPGGASDVTPRSLLKTMIEELKQPVVIVNRPGAAAVVGTLEMERAVPDGYTIGTYSYSQTLTNFTTPNPPSLANVVPIAKVMYSPAALTVNAGFPANTLAEFVRYAKANPGKVRSANSGKGVSNHIFAEALRSDHRHQADACSLQRACTCGYRRGGRAYRGDLQPPRGRASHGQSGKAEDTRRGHAGTALSLPQRADHEGIEREYGHRQLGGFRCAQRRRFTDERCEKNRGITWETSGTNLP